MNMSLSIKLLECFVQVYLSKIWNSGVIVVLEDFWKFFEITFHANYCNVLCFLCMCDSCFRGILLGSLMWALQWFRLWLLTLANWLARNLSCLGQMITENGQKHKTSMICETMCTSTQHSFGAAAKLIMTLAQVWPNEKLKTKIRNSMH